MTIDGIWVNEYGSSAELWSVGSRVHGIYRSHTGATGTYLVIGFADDVAPTTTGGAKVCLAIAWYPLDGGEVHPSWHWCSAMSGQVSLAGDVPKMSVQHCLVASTGAEGMCEQGIYVDKLTFERVSDVVSPPATSLVGPGDDRIPRFVRTETWTADHGVTMKLSFESREDILFENVRGTIEAPGSSLTVFGVSAVNPEAGELASRSIALTAHDCSLEVMFVWAGFFHPSAERATLQQLLGRRTSAATTYLQTRLDSRTFERLVC